MGQAVETVRRHYDAFERGDYRAVLALYDPEVEADLGRSGIPDLGVYHGRDGIREAWARWRGVWDEYTFEVEDLTELGDRVLSLTHIHARSKGQGVDTEVRGATSSRSATA